MEADFHFQRRVEFSDTDAAAVLHFARYFHYMEEVESAYWRSLGLTIFEKDGERPVVWPRVEAKCEYFRPALFEEVLDVHMRVIEMDRKSLSYEFRFSRNGKKTAYGRQKVVCCTIRDGKLRSVPIPDDIAERIQVAEAVGP